MENQNNHTDITEVREALNSYKMPQKSAFLKGLYSTEENKYLKIVRRDKKVTWATAFFNAFNHGRRLRNKYYFVKQAELW